MAKATTIEAVFQHHMQAVMSGNMDEIVKDYTKDSVLFTPTETFRGLDGIKAGFAAVSKMFPPDFLANMKMIKQEILGDYVYIVWSALPTVPFGGDTFYIHNGKILMQSVIFPTGR